jgi:integrase
MAVRHAKTLDQKQLKHLMGVVDEKSTRPVVDRVVFLLSFTAALRVQEIAGLQWQKNVLDATGGLRTEQYTVPGANGRPKKDVRPVIYVGSDIGKYGIERTVPMHPALEKALTDLRAEEIEGPWVIPSGKGGAEQGLKSRAHALRMRINRFYDAAGFDGCTSHSGRRSAITEAARKANFAHCSLVDVQKIAGHRQLSTTSTYIETSASMSDLINMLYT